MASGYFAFGGVSGMEDVAHILEKLSLTISKFNLEI